MISTPKTCKRKLLSEEENNLTMAPKKIKKVRMGGRISKSKKALNDCLSKINEPYGKLLDIDISFIQRKNLNASYVVLLQNDYSRDHWIVVHEKLIP